MVAFFSLDDDIARSFSLPSSVALKKSIASAAENVNFVHISDSIYPIFSYCHPERAVPHYLWKYRGDPSPSLRLGMTSLAPHQCIIPLCRGQRSCVDVVRAAWWRRSRVHQDAGSPMAIGDLLREHVARIARIAAPAHIVRLANEICASRAAPASIKREPRHHNCALVISAPSDLILLPIETSATGILAIWRSWRFAIAAIVHNHAHQFCAQPVRHDNGALRPLPWQTVLRRDPAFSGRRSTVPAAQDEDPQCLLRASGASFTTPSPAAVSSSFANNFHPPIDALPIGIAPVQHVSTR